LIAHHERRQACEAFSRGRSSTPIRGGPGLKDDHPDPAVGTSPDHGRPWALPACQSYQPSCNMLSTSLKRTGKPTSPGSTKCSLQNRSHPTGRRKSRRCWPRRWRRFTMRRCGSRAYSEVLRRFPQQDQCQQLRSTKLARTFASQTEAFERGTVRKGEQKVIVEHVTVNEGGQAIVGQVGGGTPVGK